MEYQTKPVYKAISSLIDEVSKADEIYINTIMALEANIEALQAKIKALECIHTTDDKTTPTGL